MRDRRSKEDHVKQISTSIYVTNFPEHFTFRDLWKECQEFGRVIDAFIPARRSKSGNRFGFVRFIHIKDVDRLVRNLCTIWMGRLRLHANVARFQRTPLNKVQFDKGDKGAYKPYAGAANNSKGVGHNSYVGAVKNKMEYKQVIEEHSQPSLVLDDSCILDYDYSLALMGKVSDFGLLTNLKMILIKEGFDNFILKYLGGFWVIIEFHTKEVLENFKSHVGVGSWFTSLEYASNTFVIDERVVWVDIEGVPMNVWTYNTFKKISAKWGELLFEEDKDNMSLNSKRLCIKTKMEQNIFETCKIIVKGKVFWIRAKEVSGWVPDFLEEEDGVDASDDVIRYMRIEGNDKEIEEGEINSEDPFKIYDLLKKKPYGNDKEVGNSKTLGCSTPDLHRGYEVLMFRKHNSTISDYFVAIQGDWIPNAKKYLIISVYAPQDISEKRMLWSYLNHMIDSWSGEIIIMGDFNEVRFKEDRFCSIFNNYNASLFNSFISSGGLVEVPLGGCEFTWCHQSGSKMKIYHTIHVVIIGSNGMDLISIVDTWTNINISDNNAISQFMKKLRYLKEQIKTWVRNKNESASAKKSNLKGLLHDLDRLIDEKKADKEIINKRIHVMNSLQDLEKLEMSEIAQKVKINWSIEGDENSRFFHGMLNKKRNQQAIRGILKEGTWVDDPKAVKNEFLSHFKERLDSPNSSRLLLDMDFPNRVSVEQVVDLERNVSKEEIKRAVWDCGSDKSPGPDGFTFGFYRRYWDTIENDVVDADDTKVVENYRPISLIGSVYKIIAKILANHLVGVLGDLIHEVQSAFIANRQILDGPFILDELIHWCKSKKKQSMIFKVDFEKAYDSVRWDYLDDVLNKFGFGSKWRAWIHNCLVSSKGSILVNGSPTGGYAVLKGFNMVYWGNLAWAPRLISFRIFLDRP
ncbi:RNA-directed DNA polymerase, eukaryota [Tanacetum coccineum]